ncbi:MAG TPA: hypothetical protein VNF07_03615 [Acidimicrobiales bacterium]|nr:hypothetical protein [Acidimicrobiales bacterium]
MAVTELRPRRPGEILDTALRLCRSRYLTLMGVVALIVVPLQLFSALLQLSVDPARHGTTVHGWGALAASLGPSVLGGLAAQLASAACLKPVAAGFLDEEVSWQDALEFAWSRTGDLLRVIVVVYVVSTIGLIVVLPGIYLWISWLVVLPVVLLEGGAGLTPLRRSHELVRGRWWPTFGTYLLATVALGIITAFVSGILLRVTGEANAVYTAKVLLSTIVGSITGVLTMPFLASVIVVIYFDLRTRKEGFDLRGLAALLGVALIRERPAEPPW